MPRSKSSKKWLHEHFDDPFVKKAQSEGYRSRAVYKLKEVDEKEGLIKPGQSIVDLGAAPGGWSQYAAEKIKHQGCIFSLDILPIEPIPNVQIIMGDFREDVVLQQLLALLPEQGVDLVLSDMAPNMSGTAAIDIPRAMHLVELALEFSERMLKPGGTLFMKVFHGAGFDAMLRQIRSQFRRVVIRKPTASRSRSRETYLLAKDYNI